MNDGIKLVYYIFNKLMDLLFNNMIIVQGVTVGWVIVSILIMVIITRALLNIIPSSVNSIDRFSRNKERDK